MLTYAITAQSKSRDAVIARFKKTGGKPPKDVKLLGRWTATDFSSAFDLLESDDAAVITRFALMWSDLMEIKVVPVVEDAELSQVPKRF